MKSILCFIFILFTSNTFSQTYKVFKGDTINRVDAKGKKQGLWRKYYTTDTLFSEGYYKDGKHSGTFNTFHKNGKQQSILKFRGLTEVSDATLFNDSAQMIAKGKYIDHKKDSTWIYFNGKTGKITSEEHYKKGVKVGTWKSFFPNDSVAETEVYKNGKKNGPYLKYFDNGKQKFIGNMVDDMLDGKVKLFSPDGKIWQEGFYKAGDKHGKWTVFKEDGSIESQEEYIKGVPKNPPPEVIIKDPEFEK